jgi:hypothetical protein
VGPFLLWSLCHASVDEIVVFDAFLSLLGQVNVDNSSCIDDGILNNVSRRFVGWVYVAWKLQSFPATHQGGLGMVGVFEVTDNVDGRLSFTGEDANGLGLPQTIARHDLNNRKSGNKYEISDVIDG